MARTIEQALAAAEAALDAGGGLAGTGFWPAVAQVKADPELIERHADRIAAIDARAFDDWALLTVPVGVGTLLALLGSAAGLTLVGVAYAYDGLAGVLLFYAGLAALLITTHGLGHLAVGAVVGIRFTKWFIGTWAMPQPGVKVDYAAYLRVSPARRAWMHASGAVVTKLVPFALIGSAVAADLPAWAIWALVALGAVMAITDIAWSTKSSDWMKFRREMSFAQRP